MKITIELVNIGNNTKMDDVYHLLAFISHDLHKDILKDDKEFSLNFQSETVSGKVEITK